MNPIVQSFDIDALTRGFNELEKRQVPFAVARTFNVTTLEAQSAARIRMFARMLVRQAATRSLMERAIVFNRAGRADSRIGKLSAELRLIGDTNFPASPNPNKTMARISRILIRQEYGGQSSADWQIRKGRYRSVLAGNIIPFEGLRTLTQPMSRTLYPTSIGLNPRRAISGGEENASQYKGGKIGGGAKRFKGRFKAGTRFYFASDKGIFVRNQVGKESEYDGVWWFKKRVTLRPRLGFRDTYARVMQQRLPINWVAQIENALRTAR